MWQLLATTLLLAGCNALFGIHELHPDSTTDPCTGPCECKVDDDCGAPHTACVDQITSRMCTCVAGYTMAAGGCMWTGVVDDPGFERASDAWTLAGRATREVTAVQDFGMQDPGQFVLQADMDCGDVGQVTQAITMPRRSRAEALVVRATYASEKELQPLVGIGTGWYGSQLLNSNSERNFVTSTVCLGAAHYAAESTTGIGHATPLVVTVSGSGFCDPQRSLLNLDHVDIVPATPDDGCPDPGQVPNGDAEGSGGWDFLTSGSTAKAAIVAGVGSHSSHAVQLQTALRCDSAGASVLVSVPLADASGSPALSFYHSSSPVGLTLVFDQVALPLSGGVSTVVDRYCIPAPLRGGVFQLRANLRVGGSGACTDAVSGQAILDDVVVANDPLCGVDPGIANPGFESNTALLTTSATPGSTAVIVADADAHGGRQDLQLTVPTGSCASTSYRVQVATPAVTSGAGPAVTFWYKQPPGSSVALQVTPNQPTFVATTDGQWHQATVCLQPMLAGLAQDFTIGLSNNPVCGNAAPVTVAIDDLAVFTTPMCPAM